ncbi:MAG: hypothetical protein ACOVMM_07620 [Chitinophagaceae bacterium]|jgi:hypothetical protein
MNTLTTNNNINKVVNNLVENLTTVNKPVFSAANLWQIQKMAKTFTSRKRMSLSIY